MPKRIYDLAKRIWDYHQLNHTMVKSDCIFVLGSNDDRVAERAVELYKQGLAPYIVFSGGHKHKDKISKGKICHFYNPIRFFFLATVDFNMSEAKSLETGESLMVVREPC